jgi:phosphoribosyl 1,2-cyclic phosphodiesterase
MRVRIWGTRGSYPVARAEMMRYGGNTTCVEVRTDDRCLILDAGTGLRNFGVALAHEPDPPHNFDMLITHTHWDHIIGFPFFDPLFSGENHFNIYGLQRTQSSLHATISHALSDPLLPIALEDLRATLQFHEIHAEMCVSIGDLRIYSAFANHPYRALAYRIEHADSVLTFVPDTGPFHTVLFGDERINWNGKPTATTGADLRKLAEMRAGIVALAQGADWLIYDAQFTDAQYAAFPHWGHSSANQAREIAEAAGVRELLLFHHDPHRTDAELDRIQIEQQAAAAGDLRIRVAFEGMELQKDGES